MSTTRLDRYISNNTEYTRTEVKELIKRGKVTVDGTVVKKSDVKVDSERSEVCICGDRVMEFGLRYYMLNKPQGVVCSTDDKDSQTVIDLLPKDLQDKGLFPVGRLDKDSEGFVLLTNDGDFAHKVLSAKNHVPKYYLVKLSRPFESSYIDSFNQGITLSNGETCLSAKVVGWQDSEYYAMVELFEGKYHQVKRMFASVGNHVDRLYRFQIGDLPLDPDLPVGGLLEILHKDVSKILKKTGTQITKSGLQTDFLSIVTKIKL
jgi:16S rRNA pseudouridine516 synthase